jgi:4a-hydroxytetrahydrobiopterin dehydratase
VERRAPCGVSSMVMKPNVTLYTRRDCHLCDEAKSAIVASGIAVDLTEVDIDADPALRRRYTNDVPVIEIDGVEAFRHRVDPQQFSDYVRGGRQVSTLAKESCVPCRGGVPPMRGAELKAVASELGAGWRIVEEHHLEKEFRFPDFAEALSFTNAVGAIAEREGHHPDIHLAWGKVTVTIWTHKIEGLTRSDFVLAAKIDQILAA